MNYRKAVVLSIEVAIAFLALSLSSVAADPEKVTQCSPQYHGNSSELVVVLHGMNNKAHRLDGVVSVIQSDRPNADILVPEYDSSSTSTANPLRLTRNLVQCVGDAVDEKGGYDDITLVGYSIGGLFLRKVYISAQGFDQDGISITAPRSAWADKVHRIVLLAGMNNGWSVSPKPEFMHWYTAAEIRLLEWILPNSVGRMMRSLKEALLL